MDNSFDSDFFLMETQVPPVAPQTTIFKTDQHSKFLDLGLHIITKYTDPEELDVHSFSQHDSTSSFSTKFLNNQINCILGYINVSKTESVFSCTLNTENIMLNDKQVEPFALNILEKNNILKYKNLSCEINIVQENYIQSPVEYYSPTINYFSQSSSSSLINLDHHIKKGKAHNVHDITSQLFDQEICDIHCLPPILTPKPSCTSPNLVADSDSISLNPVKINVKDKDSTDIEDDITQVFLKDVRFSHIITKLLKTKRKIYDPISINEEAYEVQTQTQDHLILRSSNEENQLKRVARIPPSETFVDPFEQCTQIIEMTNDNYYKNTQDLLDDLCSQQSAEFPTNSQNSPELLLIADDKLCINNNTNCDWKFSSVFDFELDSTPKIELYTDDRPAMVSSLNVCDSEVDEIPSSPTIAYKRKIPKKKNKKIVKKKNRHFS